MNKDLTVKQYNRDILRWSLTAFVFLACVVAILISLAFNPGVIVLKVLNVICSFCFGICLGQIVDLARGLHRYKKELK